MKIFQTLLNLPFTLTGIIPLLLSGPYEFNWVNNPPALVVKVRKFWWVFGYMKGSRAMTIGHIILLGPSILKNDLRHELIHVKQSLQYPFVYPFLYVYELMKNGYRMNRFEDEAYRLSNSIYRGKSN